MLMAYEDMRSPCLSCQDWLGTAGDPFLQFGYFLVYACGVV